VTLAISIGVGGASCRTNSENSSVATSGSTKAQIDVRATPQRAMPRYQSERCCRLVLDGLRASAFRSHPDARTASAT
jgi:hypothetical protein